MFTVATPAPFFETGPQVIMIGVNIDVNVYHLSAEVYAINMHMPITMSITVATYITAFGAQLQLGCYNHR